MTLIHVIISSFLFFWNWEAEEMWVLQLNSLRSQGVGTSPANAGSGISVRSFLRP